MTTKKSHLWQLIACTTALLVVAALAPAWADNGKREDGAGKYANLTALWWQWVFAQPTMDVDSTNTNPVLDSTGDYADVGQEDGIGPANKFFFLAGTFGGDGVRTVTVPHGKALFFPVFNIDVDNAVDPPTDNTVPELRALAAGFIDALSTMYATLDGVPVDLWRVKSPVFDYTVPDEDSIYDYFGLVGPQFEGRINPAVSDGYWGYIPPLPPGEYVLQFGSTANDLGFSLNVTYYLTVE